ncbi:MAG: type II toxin-antitoxin system PemK/MazF family toxin [Chlorobi bacterium]|nr:type II toxin-antitoxin system PemK/MazF family toxin [Chlorobiota bacterium]
MKKGDIVLLPFPFTDLSGVKTRPAIVLAQNDFDVTVAFITSQIHFKEGTDIVIDPSKDNGLKRTSLIRLNKIATIDKDIVLGKLGEIEEDVLMQINLNLKILFDL